MSASNGAAAPLAAAEVFWGEIAPCEHLVQIYASDDDFLAMLEGFAGGGLQKGDGVIIITTASHLIALNDRLTAGGFNLAAARARDQYIMVDAREIVSKFIIKGWPDERLFEALVSELILRARGNGRPVRAFGEMVAVLWAMGHHGATIQLEQLWNGFCQKEKFSLFCAYPRNGFTQSTEASIKEICAAHSRVIGK